MKLPDKENMAVIGILIAIILIFFYYILGFSGAMSALGIGLIFIIPAYFILNNFELDGDEKIIFSFFIGVGIFPAISYWLGIFIPFKIAIFITFIVLLIVAYVVRKYLRKWHN